MALTPPSSSSGGSSLAAGAVTASVATSQSTGSTSYVDLATVGPVVTVTVGVSGILLVGWACEQSGASTLTSIALSGANTLAASDVWALFTAADLRFGRTHMFTGLAGGATTVTMQYKVVSGTGSWQQRDVWALAI